MSELSERMSQIREYFESWRPAPLNILAGSGLYTGCGLRLTQWRTFPLFFSLFVKILHNFVILALVSCTFIIFGLL